MFYTLVKLAKEEGVSVYLVGGPVRDALLESPVLDLDFSVVGDGAALGKRLAQETGGEATAHPQFGTATVITQGRRIDLVTARRERYPQPGQLPHVTPGTIEDDLRRRDFTINAMALPIWPEGGRILDPMDGLVDLESGTVRVLHCRSFVDDPTRMFRAVRYEQRFGFRIDDETLALMATSVSSSRMDYVSGDRWLHELDRILGEAEPGRVLLRASELGLLSGLHPSLANDAGIRAMLKCGEDPRDSDEWMAALFSPLTTVEGWSVMQRLRLSGHRAAVARDTIGVRENENLIRESAGRPSDLYQILKPFAPQAVAAMAKLTGDPLVRRALLRYLNELRHVQSGLTGDDLLEMGAAQGPLVGEILTHLRDARLDGTVSNNGEERVLARDLLARRQEGAAKQE